MNILKRAMDGVHQLTIRDMAIFKLCLFTAALFIAKVRPEILSLHWGWYLGVFAVCYIRLIKRMFAQRK